MSWHRTDDSFHSHPKILAIPRGPRRVAAAGAWLLAGTWSAHYLTDGHVPSTLPEELGLPRQSVADLVAVGLWAETPTGYHMHDYLDYNLSADEIRARREKQSEGARKGNANRWGQQSTKPIPRRSPRQSTDRSTDQLPDQSTDALQTPPCPALPTEQEQELDAASGNAPPGARELTGYWCDQVTLHGGNPKPNAGKIAAACKRALGQNVPYSEVEQALHRLAKSGFSDLATELQRGYRPPKGPDKFAPLAESAARSIAEGRWGDQPERQEITR